MHVLANYLNPIGGGAGNDRIVGKAKSDFIYGGLGDDKLFGGDGNDLILGDEARFQTWSPDEPKPFHSTDRLYGNNGDDVLVGGADDDRMTGGNGTVDGNTALSTIIDFAESSATIFGVTGLTAADFVRPGEEATAGIRFSGFDATLTGFFDDDRISGTNGADIINDLGGNDVIRGFAGNDTIDAGTGNDIVLGGYGDDAIMGSGGDDRVFGEAGNDRLDGGSGYNRLYGGDGDDQLSMNDTDFLEFGFGLLDGGAGNDDLNGSAGHDVLRGGSGNDVLSGYALDDMGFPYGVGDDLLLVQGGTNTAIGGSGADRFLVANALASYDGLNTHAVITDFKSGVDQLGLANAQSGPYETVLATFRQLDTSKDGTIDAKDRGWSVENVAFHGHSEASLVYTAAIVGSPSSVTLLGVTHLASSINVCCARAVVVG